MTLVDSPERFWSDERVADLKRLWRDGKSATEIGVLMDVSRNAIIGKVYRLALTRDNKPRRTLLRQRKREPKRKAPNKAFAPPAPLPPPKIEIPAPVSLGLSLADLTPNACRWPYGEGPYTFCGHAQAEESSYCPFHRDLSRGEGTASEKRAGEYDRNAA